jgi:hypothetical protein
MKKFIIIVMFIAVVIPFSVHAEKNLTQVKVEVISKETQVEISKAILETLATNEVNYRVVWINFDQETLIEVDTRNFLERGSLLGIEDRGLVLLPLKTTQVVGKNNVVFIFGHLEVFRSNIGSTEQKIGVERVCAERLIAEIGKKISLD